MAEPLSRIALGLLSGVLFGFVLEKAGVTRFETIVNQFRFRDFTVLKVMLTAIVIGGVGVHAFRALGWVHLSIKPAQMAAVIVGGLVFGVGMALLGYCPGTGIAAMATGSRHAAVGVLGMLVGAAIFAELYPWAASTILRVWNLGSVTLPDITGWPAWLILTLLTVVALGVFGLVERFEKRKV